MSKLKIHNSVDIELFLNDINDKAESEAQKVFDRYQKEWEQLIKRNKLKGVEIIIGNGAATYDGANFYDSHSPMSKKRESFLAEVCQAQYLRQGAGFDNKNIK